SSSSTPAGRTILVSTLGLLRMQVRGPVEKCLRPSGSRRADDSWGGPSDVAAMITLELGPSEGGGVTGSRPISVCLVEDRPELRALVRLGLEQDPDCEIAGEADGGRSGIEGIAATKPEAVLLDLSMPDMDGLQAIPEIRGQHPDLAIIVLSGFSAD